MGIDQILVVIHHLRDIYVARCRAMAQSFCSYTLYYARDITIIYVFADLNPAGAVHDTAVYPNDEKKVLKHACRMFMLDGHNPQLLVEMVQEEDCLTCAAELLCML